MLEWKIEDVSSEGDTHQTMWRARFRDRILVIHRGRAGFSCWVEHPGDSTRIGVAQGFRYLDQAREYIVQRSQQVLDGRVPTVEEDLRVHMKLLEDKMTAYTEAAQRAAECGLYGTELRLLLEADRLRQQSVTLRQTPR